MFNIVFVFTRKTIKCSEVRKILDDLGYNFKLDAVLNSELRVMKYLNYNLNTPTPHEFIEVLLEILGNNEPQLQVKPVYWVSVQILECFYLNRTKIYDRLYESFTGRTRETLADK